MDISFTQFRSLPLVALSLAIPVNADVIYSGLQDLAIPANDTGLYLNVLTGSQSSTPGSWHINPTFGGIEVYNSANFQPVRVGTSGSDNLSNIGQHAIISSGSASYDAANAYGVSFDHMGSTFTAGTEGYVGFRVVNGAENNYGWMRVIFTGTGSPVIKDWAYNTGGGSIGVGNVIQSGSTFTLDSTAQNFTLGSAIGGSNNVIKIGSNTATLSGFYGYTGTTAVSSGTLAVSSSGSINSTSAVNVAAGGTLRYNSSTALTVAPTLAGNTSSNRAVLGGTGTIAASITLDNLGDVLSPGNSPGIQIYNANQTWASLTYVWELNDWTDIVAGTDFDQIAITGTLDLSGSAYGFDIVSLNSLNAAGLVGAGGGNLFAETDRSWTILTTTGGITNFNGLEWNINAAGFADLENGSWSIAQSGNNLVLSYASVPEPRAALLGAIGILALLRRRRN